MLTGEIKLPGLGQVPKKGLVLGGGAGVLIFGFIWWRKRQAAATATPATAADDGTDTTADDGLTDAFGDDLSVGTAGGGGTAGVVSAEPTTNAQWESNVILALSGIVDPTGLSMALGTYLTGGAVTDPTTESLIDQAIAAAGYPPVAGPNGYPPGIRTQQSTGQTTPDAPVGTAAKTPGRPATPKASAVTSTTVTLTTGAVSGTEEYEWLINGSAHAHTTTPTYTITGLKSKTKYNFQVAAHIGNAIGASSLPVTVTTK